MRDGSRSVRGRQRGGQNRCGREADKRQKRKIGERCGEVWNARENGEAGNAGGMMRNNRISNRT